MSIGGEEEPPSPLGPQGGINWLLNLLSGGQFAPPISVGVPSTGTGTGTIEEPPATSGCPAGYALSNNNQCVLIPTGTGLGSITQVQVPSSASAGGTVIIKTWFKNTYTNTLDFKVRVLISGLGIDTTSPALSLVPGQTAVIETTITIPSNAATQSYSGIIQLTATSSLSSSAILQDSEAFNLGVGVTTGGGGTATIVPSASSVMAGRSFSIQASGFGPNEIVYFVVTREDNEGIGIDAKTTIADGTITLDTMSIRRDADPGVGYITATGRTSGKVATATIQILARPEPLTADITPSATSVQRNGMFSIHGTGFGPNETVDFIVRDSIGNGAGADAKGTNSQGETTLDSMLIRQDCELGTATIRARGRQSGITATATIEITAQSERARVFGYRGRRFNR